MSIRCPDAIHGSLVMMESPSFRVCGGNLRRKLRITSGTMPRKPAVVTVECEHAASRVKQRAAEVMIFLHRRRIGRADQTGRGFVDNGDQPIPQDLDGDRIERGYRRLAHLSLLQSRPAAEPDRLFAVATQRR